MFTNFLFAVVYCGPTEWRFERRRGSSSDRKNTVRHLIQMMSITESNDEDEEERSDPNSSDENGESTQDIPNEFIGTSAQCCQLYLKSITLEYATIFNESLHL